MPNRIIKESICYSDDIDKLTAFEETVFYRMIVRADDYGRLDARPSFLKSMLFVTKQGITEKNVQDAVLKMASVGLVRLYEVDGKPFLSFPKWDLHQRVRNSKEKYPAPPENTDCGVSPQLAANCGELPRVAALIQSESNPNPNPESESKTRETRFGEFWAAYPRKQGKGAAEKAWGKIKPNAKVFDQIMSAVESQKHCEQWQKHNGQFIPNPATWLNQRRWEDEPGTPSEDETDNIFLQMLREGGCRA